MKELIGIMIFVASTAYAVPQQPKTVSYGGQMHVIEQSGWNGQEECMDFESSLITVKKLKRKLAVRNASGKQLVLKRIAGKGYVRTMHLYGNYTDYGQCTDIITHTITKFRKENFVDYRFKVETTCKKLHHTVCEWAGQLTPVIRMSLK